MQYTLDSKAGADFTPVEVEGLTAAPGRRLLSARSLSQTDGTIILEMSRVSVDGFDPEEDLDFIFAMNTDSTDTRQYHSERAALTLNIASGSTAAVTNPNLKFWIIHGALMFLGWGVLIPAGVTVARTMKHMDPTWFNIHRGANSLGLLLAIAGLIVALVKFGPLSVGSGSAESGHAIIGLLVMVIGVLQPFGGLLRPHKGDPKRCYFNLIHGMVGRIGMTLGLVNILIGAFLVDKYSAGGAMALIILAAVWIAGVVLVSLIGGSRTDDQPIPSRLLPRAVLFERNTDDCLLCPDLSCQASIVMEVTVKKKVEKENSVVPGASATVLIPVVKIDTSQEHKLEA